MNCPQCNETLVEPRELEKYCKYCGKPDYIGHLGTCSGGRPNSHEVVAVPQAVKDYNIDENRLLLCPCGDYPTVLIITDAGQGGKWAHVHGDCCSQWTLEFRTEYNDIESDACTALATSAWNQASRCEYGIDKRSDHD